MARSVVPGGSSSGRDKQSSVFSKLFLETHKITQTDSFFGKVLAIREVFSVVLAIISLSYPFHSFHIAAFLGLESITAMLFSEGQ